VDNFGAAERDDQVYTLDPSAGVVQFGDGIRGARVPAGAAVYARTYAYGGGADGNLAAGSIKQLANANGMLVRHEWPTAGGVEAETVAAAERRIPAYLANRERAVTTEDFAWLAQNVPGAEVARADVVAGLMPGIDPAASRSGVAGVASVFVIPPGERKLAGVPRPNLALLRLVFDYLRQRTLIGTQLFALAPDYVQIGVWTAVRLTDESNRTEVLAAVRQALIDYLWPLEPGGPLGAGWPMGRAVAPDELLTRSGRVPGVLAADGASIFRRDPSGWTAIGCTLSLQPYQLPDLIGVTVAVSTDPDGGTASPPWSDAPPGGAGQPVPFIPKKF
jgi:predicted phage baseplate assembly protein